MVDRGTFSDMWNDLSFVDDRVKAFVPVHDSTMLDKSFVPTAWSVICARGKDSFNHVGNRRFRILCELNLHKYEAAQSKTEKSVIVMSIVDAVREAAGIGGFVRQDLSSKQWFEVGDVIAREKVGQQLRDLMNKKGSTDSASSTQASKTTTLKPHAKNAPNRPPMTRSPPDSSEPQPKKRRSMGHRLSLASSSCDDSVDTTQSPVATADSHLFFDSSLLLNADFDEPVEAWEC